MTACDEHASLRAARHGRGGVLVLVSCRVGPNYRPPALPEGAAAPLVSLNTAARNPGAAARCLVAALQRSAARRSGPGSADRRTAIWPRPMRTLPRRARRCPRCMPRRYPSTEVSAAAASTGAIRSRRRFSRSAAIARRPSGCTRICFRRHTRSISSVASIARSKRQTPTRNRLPQLATACG